MAWSLVDICESFGSSFQVSGSVDGGRSKINHSATKSFVVRTSATNFSDVDEVQVGCLSALPVVNRTTWVSPDGASYMPYAVCRSKSVQRRSENGFVFDVTCEYSTGDVDSEQCVSSPPNSLSEIDPQVTVNIGSYDRSLYADRDGKQCWQYEGTETPFGAPVMEKIPTVQLVIEQFEASVTYEQMLERSFKVNKGTYRSKGSGLWMIGAVKAVEQSVQLAGGATDAVKVTYPISLSERYFHKWGVTPTEGNRTVYGHDTVIPLIDTSYVDDAGDVVPYLSDSGKVISGYINEDGTKREPIMDEDFRPDYLRFRTQDEINFSTFLQA